jgi:hypothetical protein
MNSLLCCSFLRVQKLLTRISEFCAFLTENLKIRINLFGILKTRKHDKKFVNITKQAILLLKKQMFLALMPYKHITTQLILFLFIQI